MPRTIIRKPSLRPELTEDFLAAMSAEFRAIMAARSDKTRDEDPDSTDPAIRFELAAVIEGVE